MITKEQIEGAANKSFSRDRIAEKSGFIVGAEWAAEQMQAEVERLKAAFDAAQKECSAHKKHAERLRRTIKIAITDLETWL